MEQKTKHSVWSSAEQTHYYVIPNAYDLPEGDFELWSPLGGQKRVDPSVLAQFEVSEDVAREQLKMEAALSFGQVQDMFSNLWSFATRATASETASSADQDEGIAKLVFELLGVNLEALQDNPEVAQNALLKSLNGLKDIVGSATSDDPEHLEQARNQMQALSETLQAHDIKVDKNFEEIPDNLQKLQISLEDNEPLKKGLADLQTLIDGIEQTPTTGQTTNEAFKALYKNFSNLLDTHQATINEESYKKAVEKSVDESLKAHMKPIDVEGWIAEARAEYRNKKENE